MIGGYFRNLANADPMAPRSERTVRLKQGSGFLELRVPEERVAGTWALHDLAVGRIVPPARVAKVPDDERDADQIDRFFVVAEPANGPRPVVLICVQHASVDEDVSPVGSVRQQEAISVAAPKNADVHFAS